MTRADAFFESIRDRNVAFIGLGVSHADMVKLFVRKGIRVSVLDKRTEEELGKTAADLKMLGVTFVAGRDYLKNLEQYDVVFRTPGMKYYLPELQKARENGVVVTSEMEMFFDLCPCRIFGVTGSDGKTTSTTLIAEMLGAQGRRVHLGGNIGRALMPIIDEIQSDDVAVVELSSFQLISMRRSPDVALITNIAPNHLDMHKDMQEYIDAKKNLIWHQNAFSKTVLNLDNEITRSIAPEVRGQCYFFSRREPVRYGAFLGEDGYLYMADKKGVHKLFSREDIRLPGIHNVENYLGAITAVWGSVDAENIHRVAKEFAGVEHRIEFVRETGGVKWYNDSIATSPTRMIAGLNSFQQKLIVIAGGYDKKIPFAPMVPSVLEHVKTLILMGKTADAIEQAVTGDPNYRHGKPKILRAENMEDAVGKAHKTAAEGDVVMLCPACASFDMYRNFELRGRHYKQIVESLPEQQ
ncbi:UDP-N-acetylmuramoyl-L-alanine--D-glutamate ligase [Candidatus Soleaferrea massiliensis]|uniref:UDP-N-acetylmuramoyl-L-alanine--D-glutamate ligase n=1 Tax=Candidatus Soleaferrea massiliensis TaxID=1470354 RepID=UPI00058CA43F|nr:UDP-N-acetylmuramoyl-L-alanine--D-glutamate ligase [Candidatus Soleaferrea massiliensis]